MIEPLKPRQASKYLASFCIGSSRPFSVAISVAPPATLRTLSPRYRSTSSSQIGVVQKSGVASPLFSLSCPGSWNSPLRHSALARNARPSFNPPATATPLRFPVLSPVLAQPPASASSPLRPVLPPGFALPLAPPRCWEAGAPSCPPKRPPALGG